MTRRIQALAVLLVASGMADAATDRERIAELEARIKLLEADAAALKMRAEQASAARRLTN
jgi:BMFP domain-containing protein YqiC